MPAWLVDDTCTPAVQYVHTLPVTVYERTAVLGHRATALNQNAAPRVPLANPDVSALSIAKQEFEAGALPPMSVMRYCPDGTIVRKPIADHIRFRRP